MTLVIACFELITALQHSCILYCCLLGGMCVHFKFPGLARMLNLYCIFVYSVIDPSGTFILGLVLAADWLFLACWLSLWREGVWGEIILSSCAPVYTFFLFKSRPWAGHFTVGRWTRSFGIWNFAFVAFLYASLCSLGSDCLVKFAGVQVMNLLCVLFLV